MAPAKASGGVSRHLPHGLLEDFRFLDERKVIFGNVGYIVDGCRPTVRVGSHDGPKPFIGPPAVLQRGREGDFDRRARVVGQLRDRNHPSCGFLLSLAVRYFGAAFRLSPVQIFGRPVEDDRRPCRRHEACQETALREREEEEEHYEKESRDFEAARRHEHAD